MTDDLINRRAILGATALSLFVPPPAQAANHGAAGLAGAGWYFYRTATSLPASSFATAERSLAQPHPVRAGEDGRFAAIYLDPAIAYRAVLRSASGATLFDIDPLPTATAPAELAASGGAMLIGYSQAAPGAVRRTVQQKLSDLVSAADFPSLQAAYDALPATGGTVMVPSGYNAALSEDLRLTKPNAGFWFLGDTLIDLGAHKVMIARSATNAFLRGMAHGGNRFGQVQPPFQEVTAYGVRLKYSGRGGPSGHGAIEIGDTTGTVEGVTLEGLAIATDTAGQYAWGIIARQPIFARFDRVTISNARAGAAGGDMGGILIDGRGGGDSNAGYVEILQPRISGGKYGIRTEGQVNACTMIGGTLNCTARYGANVGLYRAGFGGGFVVLNTEIAGWTECIRLERGTVQDWIVAKSESDNPEAALDVVIAAGATRNDVTMIGGSARGGGLKYRDDNEPNSTNVVRMIGDTGGRYVTLPHQGAVRFVSGAGTYENVIGPRGAAVPDAAGGRVVDTEARAALNALLARLRAQAPTDRL